MTYAPSEDSDQPGHPPSLIRVFAVRSKGSKGPNLSSHGQRRLIRLFGCPDWSESSLGAHHLVGFIMHRFIIMYNKLPLAVRHLDGQSLIYMCTDPDSSVNGMWLISTSQSIERSECYAPVIWNHGPYGAREQRWYWLFSFQSPGLCPALQEHFYDQSPCKKAYSNPGMQMWNYQSGV